MSHPACDMMRSGKYVRVRRQRANEPDWHTQHPEGREYCAGGILCRNCIITTSGTCTTYKTQKSGPQRSVSRGLVRIIVPLRRRGMLHFELCCRPSTWVSDGDEQTYAADPQIRSSFDPPGTYVSRPRPRGSHVGESGIGRRLNTCSAKFSDAFLRSAS